jgi:Na+/H+ antiporter NhaD/arsenite permease-like protein
LATATASNIGSVGTITGNPQNIIIAGLSHIPYGMFAAKLAPVAAIGLTLTTFWIALIYRKVFLSAARLEKTATPTHHHGPLMLKTALVMAVMVVLFFLGQPVAKVAIVGGAFLLLTRRVRPEKIYIDIDWPLLVLFVGLFVVVVGFEKAVITADVTVAASYLRRDNSAVLAAFTAGLSNVVSNVPAVLLLKPFVPNLHDPQRAWLVIAMAATLAGNFTVVGSVANLIVAQRAKASGIEIGFWSYFKIGAPLTLVTILIGLLWL